ncbi:hypothetical protein FB451DRAFT_1192436 [Mycena latifolia]|nr:hypothetical protein FB451DRAFT_1192436 [Mycena latifolia]
MPAPLSTSLTSLKGLVRYPTFDFVSLLTRTINDWYGIAHTVSDFRRSSLGGTLISLSLLLCVGPMCTASNVHASCASHPGLEVPGGSGGRHVQEFKPPVVPPLPLHHCVATVRSLPSVLWMTVCSCHLPLLRGILGHGNDSTSPSAPSPFDSLNTVRFLNIFILRLYASIFSWKPSRNSEVKQRDLCKQAIMVKGSNDVTCHCCHAHRKWVGAINAEVGAQWRIESLGTDKYKIRPYMLPQSAVGYVRAAPYPPGSEFPDRSFFLSQGVQWGVKKELGIEPAREGTFTVTVPTEGLALSVEDTFEDVPPRRLPAPHPRE